MSRNYAETARSARMLVRVALANRFFRSGAVAGPASRSSRRAGDVRLAARVRSRATGADVEAADKTRSSGWARA